MASGTLPVYKKGIPEGGLPGRAVWAGLQCPVFLVAGEADHVTKPEELEKITAYLGKSHPLHNEIKNDSEAIADSAAPVSMSSEPVSNIRHRIRSRGSFLFHSACLSLVLQADMTMHKLLLTLSFYRSSQLQKLKQAMEWKPILRRPIRIQSTILSKTLPLRMKSRPPFLRILLSQRKF